MLSVSRLDIAEIYVGLAARAIRDDDLNAFMRYDSWAYRWEQHDEWVRDHGRRQPPPPHQLGEF